MNKNSRKLTFLALMIAFNFIFTSIFRIEGMAPISSFMNILAGIIMGPLYAFYMALTTGLLRIFILGAPPFALTGAVFGAILVGLLFKINHKNYMAMTGEFIGTGIIGAIASYPLLILYTGTNSKLFWLMFIPKFCGAAIIGIIISIIVLAKLQKTNIFKTITSYFK
ncbi:energy coupling factor transporter S component ThiW [Lactobacillus sp. S2-2]|uniref:energy coupling factor transporter S component ThiW n=1 Tax=Lactobacillus sp. S2-2 TaxID=2692917 RepID=UPI001F01C3D1|nr:energy coupling factor transporter S component ThiW [Lactobacillus sp. S2-2]MCF6514601.1 energy coupling factor transporter S component ThiW [Lactobacillus sp. S2-2]